MGAHHIAREIVDKIRREHMKGKPAWIAELALADIEAWIAEELEIALAEQFQQGWDERGFHKEESDGRRRTRSTLHRSVSSRKPLSR